MRAITFTFLLFFCMQISGQAGTWNWMKGDSTVNSAGNFGVMGVASPTNEPPARYACAYWTDTAGNFWIFGGVSSVYSIQTGWPLMNDMWKFDPLINQWTWMNGNATADSTTRTARAGAIGVYNPGNKPGGNGWGIYTWTTPDNCLWMMGSRSDSNLVWRYNPAINQWACMHSGYDFSPGYRTESNTAWVDDDGKLWLFGGHIGGYLNGHDMWKYDVDSGSWTRPAGSASPFPMTFKYGVQGVPSDTTYPPNRVNDIFWKEDNGTFRFYGGALWCSSAFGCHGAQGYFADDWRFNPRTLQFTWLGGPQGLQQFLYHDVWNSYCDTNSLNHEGGTFENRAVWKVCDKVIINYKGGMDTISNALWAYLTAEYKWIKISDGPFSGYYGSRGVSNIFNYPPSRTGPASFKDKQGNLWMFGGMHLDDDTSIGRYNDLWKYVVDTTCFGINFCNGNCASFSVNISSSQTQICSGDSVQICAPTIYSNYHWNNGLPNQCITTSLAGNYYVTVTDNNGCTAESNHLAITVYPLPPVSISVNGDTLTVNNAVSQQWYLNGSAINGATTTTYIATQGGSYTVMITDSNGCTATSSPVIISGIEKVREEDVVSVYPNPLSAGSCWLLVGSNFIGGTAEVTDADGRVVFKSAIVNPKSEISFDAAKGVYLLRITSGKSSVVRKLVRL